MESKTESPSNSPLLGKREEEESRKVPAKDTPIAGRAAVLLPLALDKSFDYAVPGDMELRIGDFVAVKFRRKDMIGIVWGHASGAIEDHRLRPIERKIDLLPLPDISRRFIEWAAHYYMAEIGSVLRMAMSVPSVFKPEPSARALVLGDIDRIASLTQARRRVVDVAAQYSPLSSSTLAERAKVGSGLVRQMVAAGILQEIAIPSSYAPPSLNPDHEPPVLSPPQEAAANALSRSLMQREKSAVTLLDGVTGSGKTEVYFEAIADCLKQGKQILVLLPEIALTHQWLERFEARFGARPSQWHSDLTPRERRRTWRAVLEGKASVVVGARSALFLPYADLGLIIVDEEHESAFKQEEGVAYQARDMAVVRGHLARIPVILSSATPSLETLQNVELGRYERLLLPERHGGRILPSVELIDLRQDKPPAGSWLSQRLVEEARQRLQKGEQIMLFLNRRGYAPLMLCRRCGHRWQCPHCAAWLVEHRTNRRLQCHHCGYKASVPDSCPACSAVGELAACGPGVERVDEEAARLFPEARRLVLTSDTADSPAKAADMVRRIEEGKADIVIGTQIVAKGHNFPALTLIGIVDSDLGLSGGDLRAGERTFQLLHQVAGRAGRGDRPGHVLIQTYDSTRPVMQALASGDRDRFMKLEAIERREAGMPPFGRLASVILSGPNSEALDRLARHMAAQAPRREGLIILGPAPAPLAVLKGRHRRRFLVKCRRDVVPQSLLREWLGKIKPAAGQSIDIDIDPYSFL